MSFGSNRFSASSGVRKRVPGMNFAYSSGGTPARAAMIFTASAWLAGSRTNVTMRFQTLTTFTQSARRCARLCGFTHTRS